MHYFAGIDSMSYHRRMDIVKDGDTVHITWKCHNEEWLIKSDFTKSYYANLLFQNAKNYGVIVYSLDFMDNHIHASIMCTRLIGLSCLMRLINSRFAKMVNYRLERKGQVIMDRYRSPVIHSDRHHLNVMIYGNMNPVRAGKVKHPKDYKWSSYRFYAYGEQMGTWDLTPAPAYLNLGKTPEERQKKYREMVNTIVRNESLKRKKENYSRTLFIGSPHWVQENYDRIRFQQRIRRANSKIRRKQMFEYFNSNPDPPQL